LHRHSENQEFEDGVYAKFKDAVHQSFTLNLHAEYNRASATDALVDVKSMSDRFGKSLFKAAGRGDSASAVVVPAGRCAPQPGQSYAGVTKSARCP
jgi:hypothetical protein